MNLREITKNLDKRLNFSDINDENDYEFQKGIANMNYAKEKASKPDEDIPIKFLNDEIKIIDNYKLIKIRKQLKDDAGFNKMYAELNNLKDIKEQKEQQLQQLTSPNKPSKPNLRQKLYSFVSRRKNFVAKLEAEIKELNDAINNLEKLKPIYLFKIDDEPKSIARTIALAMADRGFLEESIKLGTSSTNIMEPLEIKKNKEKYLEKYLSDLIPLCDNLYLTMNTEQLKTRLNFIDEKFPININDDINDESTPLARWFRFFFTQGGEKNKPSKLFSEFIAVNMENYDTWVEANKKAFFEGIYKILTQKMDGGKKRKTKRTNGTNKRKTNGTNGTNKRKTKKNK